ncbi:MAG: hypothetical protein C5B49_08880 [Bdellovibrio sp.]|nr:MAG: hypothetical protein C5B49_08880 [Bdellovibrio sp.]
MSNLKLRFDSGVSEFLRNSIDLEKEASIHSFILSLAARYQKSGRAPTCMVRGIDKTGQFIIAGIQTESNRPIIISKCSENNARLFARELATKISDLPGVNGPVPGVDTFAKVWTEIKSCGLESGPNLRLFELRTVNPPRKASGSFRVAKAKDEAVIFGWLREFHHEAVPHDPVQSDDELYRDIRDATKNEQFFVWEDEGNCVSLVVSRRETSSERWVGPVYTPKNLRGRGYASSLVAAVSERIVGSGKKGMLFTDLANPTSNGIYQKIGYNPVADFRQFVFTSKPKT